MTAYRRCVAFWPFDHVEDFQLDVVAADVLEQAGAGAQQDRDQVDADLVDEAGPQQLLTDAGAEDVDILAAGGGCCAGQGFARALDEGVHASLGHLWRRAVRDDERRGPRRGAGPIRASPRDRQVVGAPAGDTRAALRWLSARTSRPRSSSPKAHSCNCCPPSPIGSSGRTPDAVT